MVLRQLLQCGEYIIHYNIPVICGHIGFIYNGIGRALLQRLLCKRIAVKIATAQCKVNAAGQWLARIGLYEGVLQV